MPARHLVDVHVLLTQGGELLLSQRRGDSFDGLWHLPSGKVETGEDVLSAASREAEEEVGVVIDPADLHHVHTVHANGSGHEPRFGHFFTASRWTGAPDNREPDKCYRIAWFDLNDLPEDLIAYSASGINGYRNDISFSTMGWRD